MIYRGINESGALPGSTLHASHRLTSISFFPLSDLLSRSL